MIRKKRPHNSTYPKGGVSCSIDSFVINQTLVFQIKFCGKSPALRVAAKRYLQWFRDSKINPPIHEMFFKIYIIILTFRAKGYPINIRFVSTRKLVKNEIVVCCSDFILGYRIIAQIIIF